MLILILAFIGARLLCHSVNVVCGLDLPWAQPMGTFWNLWALT
jgi:hypothetical protein